MQVLLILACQGSTGWHGQRLRWMRFTTLPGMLQACSRRSRGIIVRLLMETNGAVLGALPTAQIKQCGSLMVVQREGIYVQQAAEHSLCG